MIRFINFPLRLPTTHYLLLTTHVYKFINYSCLIIFMRMLCYKCDHLWNYKGKNSDGKGYITCPGCYYKIRPDRAMVKEPFKQNLLTELPKKESLPIKLPTKLLSFKRELPTTHYIPPKRTPIMIQNSEPVLEDEEIESVDNGFNKPQINLTNLPDFNMEILKNRNQENLIEIREIKNDLDVRIIPTDYNKLIEHQRNF